MTKSTIIASCISAMVMSADLWNDYIEDIDTLQAQQHASDESQMDLLSSVMQELALLRSEMDARPSLEEWQLLQSRVDS